MLLFRRHGADDADIRVAPESVLEQVRELGIAIGDVGSAGSECGLSVFGCLARNTARYVDGS